MPSQRDFQILATSLLRLSLFSLKHIEEILAEFFHCKFMKWGCKTNISQYVAKRLGLSTLWWWILQPRAKVEDTLLTRPSWFIFGTLLWKVIVIRNYITRKITSPV